MQILEVGVQVIHKYDQLAETNKSALKLRNQLTAIPVVYSAPYTSVPAYIEQQKLQQKCNLRASFIKFAHSNET